MNQPDNLLHDRSAKEKPPAVFPKRIDTLPRIRLTESPDALILTDFGVLQRIAVWGSTLLVAGLVVATMVSLVQAVAASAPPSQSPAGQQGVNMIGVLVVAAVTGMILYFVLGLVLRLVRCHRRFVLRVGIPERRCVCKSRLFGFTTRRIKLDTDRMALDVGVAQVPAPRSNLWGGLVVRLGLIVLGPIGWVILLIASLTRSRTRAEAGTGETLELVGLIFSEDGRDRFVVAVADEALATQFVLAWDRVFSTSMPS